MYTFFKYLELSSYCDIYISFFSLSFRYLVTHLMGADLNNIIKTQRLSNDHVQFLVYQILRGLKVSVFKIVFLKTDL